MVGKISKNRICRIHCQYPTGMIGYDGKIRKNTAVCNYSIAIMIYWVLSLYIFVDKALEYLLRCFLPVSGNVLIFLNSDANSLQKSAAIQ